MGKLPREKSKMQPSAADAAGGSFGAANNLRHPKTSVVKDEFASAIPDSIRDSNQAKKQAIVASAKDAKEKRAKALEFAMKSKAESKQKKDIGSVTALAGVLDELMAAPVPNAATAPAATATAFPQLKNGHGGRAGKVAEFAAGVQVLKATKGNPLAALKKHLAARGCDDT